MAGLFRSHRNGFTIVEILVVIAVVGILAAITIVSYNVSQQQAQDTRTIAMVKSVATALDSYYTANGVYPGDNETTSTARSLNTCIAEGYKDNICATTTQSGSVCGNSTKNATSSPALKQRLSTYLSTSIPKIEYPTQSMTMNSTWYDEDGGESECTITIQQWGPIYTPACMISSHQGVPLSTHYCYRYENLEPVLLPAKAYLIRYNLRNTEDCGVPGSFNATQVYRDLGAQVSGTVCVVARGEHRE